MSLMLGVWGCEDKPPKSDSDTPAGAQMSGEAAGDRAGAVAGDLSGEMAGVAAGETAGAAAGETAGAAAGDEVIPPELEAFTVWRNPIDTYIAEATAELGADVDISIHDLYVHNGRLYIGYGDANLNAGGVSPIQILYFDSPEGDVTADPLMTGEESIERFRTIDGEVMIAGVDSTNDDELTSRPLIEGNFLRTRDGAWEKYRSVPGGEHVHDVTRFMEGLWAVGSGADNRFEWDNYGVYRYLWFSGDGGVTWSRYKRVLREVGGDTRYINLLAVGPRLYIFGFLNPSDGPFEPRNEMILGATGEPTPLISATDDERDAGMVHPFAQIYGGETYRITDDEGVVSGFDIVERRWRSWLIHADGAVEIADEILASWGMRRMIDLFVNPEDGSLTVLMHDDQEFNGNTGRILHGPTFKELVEVGELTFGEEGAPVSIAHWGDHVYLGQQNGTITRAELIR